MTSILDSRVYRTRVCRTRVCIPGAGHGWVMAWWCTVYGMSLGLYLSVYRCARVGHRVPPSLGPSRTRAPRVGHWSKIGLRAWLGKEVCIAIDMSGFLMVPWQMWYFNDRDFNGILPKFMKFSELPDFIKNSDISDSFSQTCTFSGH